MKRITWIAFICCCLSGGMSAQTYDQTVRQALSAAEHDSLDQAEELFRQALKISPGDHRNALVYQYIGQVIETKYWKNPSDVKTVEEIIFNYSKAIELQPQNRSMLFSRANFYLSMEYYGKAIHDYTTILEHDRQNTDALNRRAFAYYQNREYDKAENDYNAVLAIKPSDYASALGKALVMQKTFRLGEAIKRMEFLVVEHPDRAELYAVRASMYKESGKMELALVDISRAIQLEPKNPAYYSQRADIYEAQGKKKMAAADRRKAASR